MFSWAQAMISSGSSCTPDRGTTQAMPTSPSRWSVNAFHIRHDHPNMLKAMGTYVERYVYDAVGNILQMQHHGSDPAHPGWTRGYDYAETSLIEDGAGGAALAMSNRLTSTTLSPSGANPQTDVYEHDPHGNMVRLPHLGGAAGRNVHWDYRDRLRQTDLASGSTSFYVYDTSGQRVRTVWEKAPGLLEERIYVGGFEVFRRHGGPIGADTATLERETLHVMDDKQRIALVETRTLDTAGDDRAPRQLIRYQLGDHLGSVALELDDQALIISYEEYSPYGSSMYQAVRSQTETPKRYRYIGKERDESSGLCYYGARYYIPWLGRWSSADPEGLVDGTNVFSYVTSNPVRYLDEAGAERKDKSIDTLAGFEAFLKTTGKDHPILNIASYGGKDPEEKSEHRKLYFHESELFPQVRTPAPGRTDVHPKQVKEHFIIVGGKEYITGYQDYRISVRVFQGQTPDEMSDTLTHERIHLEHKLAVKGSNAIIAAENLAKSKLLLGRFRDEGLEKSGTPVDKQKERVADEMTKRFGADVSQLANTEALAYSQAFAETYKKNTDVALKLLVEIQAPAKGTTFHDASAEAQGIAIKNIVGVASTVKDLKELRAKFTTVFKDKKDPRFVEQVVNAIDAKIGDLSKKR